MFFRNFHGRFKLIGLHSHGRDCSTRGCLQCYLGYVFLITTEITETTEVSGRDVPLYNNAFFKKALL